MSKLHKLKQDEKGFTLVELAIVMIIIGLLITGILKGQEMIANAQISSTVSQIKSVEAAIVSFQDKYNGLPGDLQNVAQRLPASCAAAPCQVDGDGNNRIDGDPSVAPNTAAAAGAVEGPAVFPQLSSADLLGGVDPGAAAGGDNFLDAEITGTNYYVGFAANGAGIGAGLIAPAASVRPGHYLTLRIADPATAVGSATAGEGLTPNEAQRIDTKLDDGFPDSGSALAGGVATCTVAPGGGGADIYNEVVADEDCVLFVRIVQ